MPALSGNGPAEMTNWANSPDLMAVSADEAVQMISLTPSETVPSSVVIGLSSLVFLISWVQPGMFSTSTDAIGASAGN